MAANLSKELHTLAEQLPDNATWDDVMERLRFRQMVAEGKTAAERDEFADDDEVQQAFAKFGVRT